jgi:deoxyribodipyrimidine photolyase-related protein
MLYWDFLHRHRDLLSEIPRMVLQVRNVDRLSEAECQTIREQASRLRAQATGHS